MARLTKRMVDQITPGEKERMHWDELRGFGVRVWPSGRKVYMVMSRVKGRLRRIVIGTHGPITAEKARGRAHELLSEAKNGRDPAKELAAHPVKGKSMACVFTTFGILMPVARWRSAKGCR